LKGFNAHLLAFSALCSATLAQSVPVLETFEGQTVWEGVVHVFDLEGHPKATRAYAWSSPIEGSTKILCRAAYGADQVAIGCGASGYRGRTPRKRMIGTGTLYRIVIVAVVVTVAVTNNRPARAGPDECKVAIDSYNSAVEEISDTMKRYSRCVSDSQGHDDCSSEFRRLKSSQSDFEVSVSNYGSECQ
jgi:hypothetical protein